MSGRLILACLGFLIAALPARAEDETRAEIAMQNEILELRQDLETMRAQLSTNGAAAVPAPVAPQSSTEGAPPAADITATLLDRVSRLEDENRSLRGTVDELRNTVQQQGADLAKQVADLSFRVQTLEGGITNPGGSPAGSSNGSSGGNLNSTSDAQEPATLLLRPPSGVRPTITPPPQKAGSLQSGYAALARRDYLAAEAAARASLRGPHAYDASFLLAQSLAGQKNYQQAALAYDDAYTKQRTGAHASDALVGLAGSLAALGDRPAACATLNKLRAEFPALRPDVKASAGAVGRRAACH